MPFLRTGPPGHLKKIYQVGLCRVPAKEGPRETRISKPDCIPLDSGVNDRIKTGEKPNRDPTQRAALRDTAQCQPMTTVLKNGETKNILFG